MLKNNAFFKEVCAVAIPVALQSMLQSSFGIVDQVMIGQLGSVSIAAVGFAAKFASIVNVVLAAVGAVAGIMIAQYVGAKDNEEAQRSFNLNMILSIGIGLAFFLVALLKADDIMSVYSMDQETVLVAADYLRIVGISFIPLSISGCIAVWFRCYERANWPLYFSLVAAFVNSLLNYVFIFGKFGIEPMGAVGAAIATTASAIVGMLLSVIYLFVFMAKEKMHFSIRIKLTQMSLGEYLVILMPILINELLWSVGENVYTGIYGHIGTKACAAMTLTNPIQGLMIGALSGIAAAAGILIGKRLGSGEFYEAYDKSKTLIKYGIAGSVILSIALITLRGIYVNIYNVEASVKLMGSQLLLIFALISPIKVLNMILGGGILRSGGKTKLILYIDIIGTWLIGVPVGYISAFILGLPIMYVYLFLSMEEAVRLCISLYLFRKKTWIQKI